MEPNRRVLLQGLLGAGLMSAIQGCAAMDSNAPVFHGFQIEVDKSVGRIVNITYSYGDDFVNVKKPSAIAIGPWTSYDAPMRIPDHFEASWETSDGKKHEAKVSVKSRLPSSIENKIVAFVIMKDHVEGYVLNSAISAKRELFVSSAKPDAKTKASK